MTSRYLAGERPDPTDGELAAAWGGAFERYAERIEACMLHEALEALWAFIGEANRFVDARQPWTLAKAATAGDTDAASRLRDVLGDLLEACRVVTFAAAPFIPSAAERAAGQLGAAWAYGPDGNGGPPLADLVAWGALGPGRIGEPAPLFPRLEADAEDG
jgi:methionyl-tRNA synthetase